MTDKLKKYETIGCCGIDCGLCPRFISQSESACPGCGGANFSEKHPSCGFLSCCTKKHGLEVCAECRDYPCSRFDSEKSGFDSFVTHRKVFTNLDFIKNNGIDCFVSQQKIRMNILTDFIENFDDGRSKSYFCLSCTLLPLDKLQESHRLINSKQNDKLTIKEQNRYLKDILQMIADNLKIDLKLNRKK
jgi:Protein of unknown function (DUF3795)